LSFVEEVDLASIFNSDADAKKRSDLENEIGALKGKVTQLNQQIDRLLEHQELSERVQARIKLLEQERPQLLESTQVAERELQSIGHGTTDALEIKSLIAQVQRQDVADKDAIYQLRQRINSKLQSTIDTMYVAPAGSHPLFVRQRKIENKKPVAPGSEPYPFFWIKFTNGEIRHAVPNRDDPGDFESIISAEVGSELAKEIATDLPHTDWNLDKWLDWLEEKESEIQKQFRQSKAKSPR
jgi:hypothetical protein